MADEKKAPEALPSVKQVEIAGAIFDRRDGGSLVIITPGGVDPSFDADQVVEIRGFLDDSDKWAVARAKAQTAGDVQIAKAAAAREAAADEPVVVVPAKPRPPRAPRPAPHAAADARKAAAAKAKSEADAQAKATAEAKVSAAPRAATAAEEAGIAATVKAEAKPGA